jgi:hypothetical protein
LLPNVSVLRLARLLAQEPVGMPFGAGNDAAGARRKDRRVVPESPGITGRPLVWSMTYRVEWKIDHDDGSASRRGGNPA